MDKKYNATELINKAVEVQNHLVDEESKQLYDIRLKYLIYKNRKMLRNDVVEFMFKYDTKVDSHQESPIDRIIKNNENVDNIIIFGSGMEGHFVLGLLHKTKYKSKNILFCDNDISKQNTVISGISVISPDELTKKYLNSIVIIGSNANRASMYQQLQHLNYPNNRILACMGGGYQSLLGLSNYWYTAKFELMYNFDGEVESIVIIGEDINRNYALNVLKHSIFNDIPVLFCVDETETVDKSISNVPIISIDELVNKHRKSIVIIADVMTFNNDNSNDDFNYLLKLGYPKERIFNNQLCAYRGWQYFDYFEPNENEIFVDGGSLDATTAFEFKYWATKGYDYIYSFEVDPVYAQRCRNNFKIGGLKGQVVDKGLWNKKDILHFTTNVANGSSSKIADVGSETIETASLDEILNDKPVTYIKFDIEGAEYNALLGAEKTIKKWRPRLAICIYHKPEDILELPALLLDMQPNYNFALRTYASHGNETVLYAF